jgi:hypothetical protein
MRRCGGFLPYPAPGSARTSPDRADGRLPRTRSHAFLCDQTLSATSRSIWAAYTPRALSTPASSIAGIGALSQVRTRIPSGATPLERHRGATAVRAALSSSFLPYYGSICQYRIKPSCRRQVPFLRNVGEEVVTVGNHPWFCVEVKDRDQATSDHFGYFPERLDILYALQVIRLLASMSSVVTDTKASSHRPRPAIRIAPAQINLFSTAVPIHAGERLPFPRCSPAHGQPP